MPSLLGKKSFLRGESFDAQPGSRADLREKPRRPLTSTLGVQGDHMAKFLGLIAALAVFSAWLSVVGNPHVVETVIGLVLAVITGFWVFFKARKFGAPPK